MCTKHEACSTTKNSMANPQAVSCSSLKITAIRAAGVDSNEEGCCGSRECATNDPDDEPAQLTSVKTQFNQSWKIEGMDCPSCARKVETALKKVGNVIDAKVLFATEKLVVKFNTEEAALEIEQAVRNAGFTAHRIDAANPVSAPIHSDWKSVIKQNAQILSIAGAMILAAIVQPYFPQISDGMFILTCLAGLYPIGKKAIQLARSGTPFAIETLMSVAALGALYLGETVEAAMVLLLFLIGERLEAFAASKARSGVQALMALVPETATKIVAGERITVAAHELKPGDVVEVSPGSRLPADGQLHEASASFDESALTGESLPVERYQGDSIMAGAVVADQVVRFTITSKQGENAIDRILHLIEEAESRKAPLERFLDKFSRWYTPLMMLVSLAVVVIPPTLFAQPWETWVYRGLALLLIACPCALVISTPAAITSGLAAAARRGALIKGGAALEQLGKIESIAFDKTGTLTKGKPEVTDVVAFNGWDEEQLLRYVAAVEMGSSHPLATSLVKKVQAMALPIPEAIEKRALVGSGVSGVVEGKSLRVLAPSKANVPFSDAFSAQVEALEMQGKTVVVVFEQENIVGLIAWQDTLREDAKAAIEALRRLGIDTIMLTGDNPRSAATMSAQLGIDFKASLLPQDKVEYIQQLAQQKQVAMVGDGINDAPAMKAASIGIAMGGGTDVALETADAAITHNRLVELATMIELSQATLANIRQNVTLALGLKSIFLVTSLLGITGLWVAVLADSGATALVTLNALRLLKFKK
ncbi:zinc/cadmium/mercury/lead-transporting ATPase [Vibrio anguillarum]|uniref:zinc/cadmium/mercury/lead-transporting ATPase n=1 Tax=Vibrio anguillarum TaxID=55601 RepID=UPI00097E37CE|nr:zinc/cadmium/mercury/lead-transporting ATPase [Vibrio anguillarum]MBF4446963.1 zinc/cadmium/mercury/lead-transporting ATPase [Vibrio anguillarum]MBT2960015.1 zinc/cadmium/mercury/lead-transporting ATPase [Vibrio anguillarum]MBY7670880.1 zinc/cadmium/mercury/lead-transporting ATPase [Vibrio anguillarum]STY55463.1 Lead, cadmium, zinc and mercury-transporting ATPase [Vibrio anguillarum]